MTGLTTDTYFFDAAEVCTIFAETITEIKASEVDVSSSVIGPSSKDVRPEPYGIQDYAKALQIVAHELYIEKMRLIMRNNCHNSAFMTLKVDKTAFCTNQLDSYLDLTLWNERLQIQACTDSLNLLDGLTATSIECINDPDADECDPCSKHYDFFFDRYDVFVL